MKKSNSKINRWAILLTCALLMYASLAYTKNNKASGHLKIEEVSATQSDLKIKGHGFGFGSHLKVTLGSVAFINHDITEHCVTFFNISPQEIICELTSIGGLPPAGDYLLTVTTGAGKRQSDEYDLTIGAVGPKGDKGDSGSSGISGYEVVEGNFIVPVWAVGHEIPFFQRCPVGKVVLGGGWNVNAIGSPLIYAKQSIPRSAGDSWTVRLKNTGEEFKNIHIIISAICATSTP